MRVKRSLLSNVAISLLALAVLPSLSACGLFARDISTPSELAAATSGSFTLKNDIDLSGMEWKPISFNGTLNGNGHKISGLRINDGDEAGVGLYSTASGTIKDLVIENAAVRVSSAVEGVGILCGEGKGLSVQSVTVSGTLKAENCSYVGGIVGSGSNLGFSNVVSKADVSGFDYVGGIVGKISLRKWRSGNSNTYGTETFTSNIATLTNEGKVEGKGDCVGGILGSVIQEVDSTYYSGRTYVTYLTVNDCANYGVVEGTGNRVGGIVGGDTLIKSVSYCNNHEGANVIGGAFVGGIAGECASVDNCSNGASVTSNKSVYQDKEEKARAGGIVGVVHGPANNCRNYGSIVSNSTGKGVGGIAGKMSPTEETEMADLINRGSVKGNGEMVGGIAGILYGYPDSIKDTVCTIKSAENYGDVTSSGKYVAGIIGYNDTTDNYYGSGSVKAKISSCANYGEISSTQDYVGGVLGYGNAVISIRFCENNGTIRGAHFVGGVAGYGSELEHCTNKASVTGAFVDSSLGCIGGVAGFCTNINSCANEGEVRSPESGVGGIAGALYILGGKVFAKNENRGSVSGYRSVGGIVGYVYCRANTSLKDSYVECSDNHNYAGRVYASDTAAGGIIGSVHGAEGLDYFTVAKARITILGCSNAGTVEAINDYAGAILGFGYYVDMNAAKWSTNSNAGSVIAKHETTNDLYGYYSYNNGD